MPLHGLNQLRGSVGTVPFAPILAPVFGTSRAACAVTTSHTALLVIGRPIATVRARYARLHSGGGPKHQTWCTTEATVATFVYIWMVGVDYCDCEVVPDHGAGIRQPRLARGLLPIEDAHHHPSIFECTCSTPGAPARVELLDDMCNRRRNRRRRRWQWTWYWEHRSW